MILQHYDISALSNLCFGFDLSDFEILRWTDAWETFYFDCYNQRALFGAFHNHILMFGFRVVRCN